MEINVGDYVRYKEFSYDKEVKIGKKIDIFGNVDTSRGRILEHNITKHSKDIIDLIEVGDYVNGRLVVSIMYDAEDRILGIETLGCLDFENYEIKTVLTKEQFEANAYILEKER